MPRLTTTPTPISLWHFDGDLTDEMGVADLTVAHGTRSIARYGIGPDGGSQRALFCDGFFEAISADPAPSALRITGALTVQAIVCPVGTLADTGGLSILVACSGEPEGSDIESGNFLYDLRLTDGRVLATFTEKGVGVNIGPTSSGTALQDGVWQHVALTRSAAGVTRMFLDGVQLSEDTLDMPTGGTLDRVRIGGWNHSRAPSADAGFWGLLSSVKICNTDLTFPQIVTEYEESVGSIIETGTVFSNTPRRSLLPYADWPRH